jgi:N-acetylmuramoyl-L-alanine amidase
LVGAEDYAQRPLSDVHYLVIHHSAVDADTDALAIARYHVINNGWPGIGYHFVIHWDGQVDYVGDLKTIRYNVASRNREVVGICLEGNFMTQRPKDAQLESARKLVEYLRTIFPAAAVVGHRDIAVPGWETSCPGDTYKDWLPS